MSIERKTFPKEHEGDTREELPLIQTEQPTYINDEVLSAQVSPESVLMPKIRSREDFIKDQEQKKRRAERLANEKKRRAENKNTSVKNEPKEDKENSQITRFLMIFLVTTALIFGAVYTAQKISEPTVLEQVATGVSLSIQQDEHLTSIGELYRHPDLPSGVLLNLTNTDRPIVVINANGETGQELFEYRTSHTGGVRVGRTYVAGESTTTTVLNSSNYTHLNQELLTQPCITNVSRIPQSGGGGRPLELQLTLLQIPECQITRPNP